MAEDKHETEEETEEANTPEDVNIAEELRYYFAIPVAHFPDRSARLLFKDKENVRGLVELVASELVMYLDFSNVVELNTSFVSETLQEQISDMVFSVPFKDANQSDDLLIYILIEHQSTVDRLMPFRMLFYMCHIWDAQRKEWDNAKTPVSEQQLRPILPIVYYTGEQRWQTPLSLMDIMDVPDMLARFVPQFDTLFLGVKDTDIAELTKNNHLLGWLLALIQKEFESEESMVTSLHSTLAHLETLPPEEAAQYRNAILYIYHLILFRRPTEERERLVQLVQTHIHDEEVKSIIMTGAEALIEQGKAQGIEQGIQQGIEQGMQQGIEQGMQQGMQQGIEQGMQQGKAEGMQQGEILAKQANLIRIMQFKFDDLSEYMANQVNAIEDISKLDDLLEQVLTANVIEEIEIPK